VSDPPARDPRVDPEPGDLVYSTDKRMALVLNVRDNDDDPDFGTHTVRAREDTRWGARRGVSMSLETWRRWAAGGRVFDPSLAETFNKGGIKAVLEEGK
jgi:hypothetical protein